MSSLNISIELKDTLSMLSSEKKNFEIFKDLIKKCDNVEAEDIEYKDVENKDVQYKDENTQTLSSDIIKKASKSVHADCTLADYKEYNNHSIINVYIINVYIINVYIINVYIINVYIINVYIINVYIYRQ